MQGDVKETVSYLEMTSPDDLVPGRLPSTPLSIEKVGQASLEMIRTTYDGIGAPHGWIGRSRWSSKEWDERLSRPNVHTWIARVDEDVAGMVELEVHALADVEITVFGLLPDFVGKGLGGHLLTLATRLAWGIQTPDGSTPRRVWLHTSSRDHPHARRNYEARGFRQFRTERRTRERA
jgi:GNAT superfamily N-acetyltransferase